MRPKGTRKSYAARLTPEEKSEILRLSEIRPRITQRQIAKQFKCGVDTIRQVQKSAAIRLFPELTPAVEAEAVALLRQGTGQARTGKLLGISEQKIRKVMRKYNIIHRTGDPGLPAAKRSKIIKHILKREEFGNHIAEKEDVSNFTVLRIAHELLGAGRFRNNNYPLTFQTASDANVEANVERFAERIIKKTLGASVENFAEKMNRIYVAMVQEHLKLWHAGQVPADRDLLLYEILETSMPKVLRGRGPLSTEQWDEHRIEVAGYIRAALDHVAGPQSRWTN